MYEYHLSLEKRYIYTFGYLDVFATNNPRSVSEKPLGTIQTIILIMRSNKINCDAKFNGNLFHLKTILGCISVIQLYSVLQNTKFVLETLNPVF